MIRRKSRSVGRPRSAWRRGNLWLFGPAAALVAACLLFSGGPTDFGMPLIVVALLGTATLTVAIAQGGLQRLHQLPLLARLALIAMVIVAPLQLIPLPPSIWHALPGRALATDILASVGMADRWRPLTLDIDDTLLTAAVMLWMLGLFTSVLMLDARRVRQMVVLIVAIGSIHVLIGAVQVISRGTVLTLYPPSQLYLTGLFANKNHAGLFIGISIVLGLWLVPAARFLKGDTLFYIVPVLLLGLILEFATNSRAGLVLSALGVLCMIMIHTRSQRRGTARQAAIVAGASVALVVVMGIVLADTPLVDRLLGRFSYDQSVSRLEIWRGTWPLIRMMFPVGSGFGIFPALYASREPLELLGPAYANHAHNDYLELVMEAGVLGVVIPLLLVAALVQTLVRAWPIRREAAGRLTLTGGIVVAMVLAHSVVDYPLRRLGMDAVFAVALASMFRLWLYRPDQGDQASGSTRRVAPTARAGRADG